MLGQIVVSVWAMLLALATIASGIEVLRRWWSHWVRDRPYRIMRRASRKLERQRQKKQRLVHRASYGRDPEPYQRARKRRLRRISLTLVVVMVLGLGAVIGYAAGSSSFSRPSETLHDQDEE